MTVTSIIVSPNDRHLICLGSNQFNTTSSPNGTFDPMTRSVGLIKKT